MLKWDQFLDDARNLGADTFVLRHATPVLVLVGVEQQVGNLQPDGFKTGHSKSASLTQALRAAKPVAPISNAAAEDMEPVNVGTVFLVQKRPGNAYANRVSIGRTKTNDLIIAWPLVSKFHAYLTRTGDDAFTVTDAGATNGSMINGAPMVAGIETPLADRSVLRLGPYRFQFLLPKSFHEFLLNPPPEVRHGR